VPRTVLDRDVAAEGQPDDERPSPGGVDGVPHRADRAVEREPLAASRAVPRQIDRDGRDARGGEGLELAPPHRA